MSAPASRRVIDLFDYLRATGSDLPASNSEAAYLIADALAIISPDSEVIDLTREQLEADFRVLAEEIFFKEQE